MNTLTIARLQKRNDRIEAPKLREVISEQVGLDKPDLLETALFGDLSGYCKCFRVEVNAHDFSQEWNTLGDEQRKKAGGATGIEKAPA